MLFSIIWISFLIKLVIILVILLAQNAFADTATTADVTEKSAGATHVCGRNNAECTYDPRSDIFSDGGSDDDEEDNHEMKVAHVDGRNDLSDDDDEDEDLENGTQNLIFSKNN